MLRPHCSRFARRGRLAVAVAAVTAAVVGTLPGAATASTTISGVHVTGISSSAFSVALNSLGSGWRYRLFASTTKSNVYAANLSKAQQSALASRPSMTLSSLRYTTAPYWWRIQAYKGSSRRTSNIYSLGLRPGRPTGVSVHVLAGRLTYLTWSSGAATGFNVQTATDQQFTQSVTTYTTRGNGHQFTPYLVTQGHSYFVRVRAINDGTRSGWSAVTTAGERVPREAVRVMTYNILTNTADGSSEGGNTVAAWHTARRDGAAKLIEQAAPDLVAIEEGSGFIASGSYVRMVDDLVSALGGAYGLAHTEVRPAPRTKYFRTGDYILYKKSTFRDVAGSDSNWFSVGSYAGKPWYGVYDVMENIATGGRLLFVATHLATGGGSSADTARENETKSLLSTINDYNSQHGNLPIVYAGDFNSHPYPGHVDGPGVAMAAARIPNSLDVAQALTNARFDSANMYMTTPPAFAHNIDHIFVPLGTGVSSWRIVINLVRGKLPAPIPSDHNPVVANLWVAY